MKNRFLRIVPLILILALTGCGVDLGTFEKGDGYKSYYESFGDVDALYDGGKHSYDIEKSLFNADLIQGSSWADEDDEVKKEEYLYIILPFKKALKIECLALAFMSPFSSNIEFNMFYYVNSDYVPEKIKYLSSPDSEPIYDDDGNYIGEQEIVYDDPSKEESILSGSLSLIREEWTSYTFGGFKQEGYEDGYLHTGQDGLLYIRIENNSGYNRETLSPVQFTFVDLIVRAVD